ncbi:hypothetical protein DID88_008726 [Monilinia fructigena]|uniref:nicotinamidase n=1 Tax=Monilinia fructigena TaxID=38457 RepID=A0A395J683_9HELO|nr:hypothetical protein DID88_008726 [Monilinia fructigena]
MSFDTNINININNNTFKPALIIVDLQEDFLPPNGSLAVTNGREAIPIINNLINLPFHLKIATKDWHPSNHTSFASNHPVEMYSAFYDPLENPRYIDSGLAGLLKDEGITDVFVVGLAADYCVKCTAEDSAKEGFKTFIIDEGTRPVDPAQWERVKFSLGGVKVVSYNSEDVDRVRNFSK